MLHLTWLKSERGASMYHLVRHHHARQGGFSAHDHDFAEVMWVEIGTYAHTSGTVSEQLGPGELRCIRPADRHAAWVSGDGGVLVNLAFKPAAVAHLARRHGAAWPWSPGTRNAGFLMGEDSRQRIQQWARELSAPWAGQLELESCLLDIARLVNRGTSVAEHRPLPAWLREGLRRLIDECGFASGVPRLAQLCGRSDDHVNRAIRAQLGRTAGELIAELRVDWVASALRNPDCRIAEALTRAGVVNRTHFNRLFAHRYGATPQAYRSGLAHGSIRLPIGAFDL